MKVIFSHKLSPPSFFQDILEKVKRLSPRALVVDSIQTVYLRGVAGSPGSLSQVWMLILNHSLFFFFF